MIERLCALLEDAGVELSEEELRDVLWFAATTARSPREEPGGEPTPPQGAAGPASGTADGDDEGKGARRHPAEAPADGEPEPGPTADAGLYAPGVARTAVARPARAVGVRGVRALPATRGLSRALRPLRRSVPSRTSFRVDETATAEWIAETGLPDVVLRPRPERWLSVALVVDDGPSMVLWQQLAAELRGLLERQGTFRSVRTYGLDSVATERDEPVLRARPYAPGAPRRTARQLTDTSGRTVMLVLSDGVGPGWRDGAIPRLLRRWARHAPVAVLQPLPARMWPERGMPTQRLLVDAGGREGAPGRALSVRHPVLPRGLVTYEGTPVPVLELAEGELGAWAALTGTGGSGGPLPVLLLDGAEKPVAARATAQVPEPTAEERLRRFRGAASPEGQRLAGALATVHPLTLPVMRLIHQAGAGGPERFHPAQLAEVFLGGLLRRRAGSAEEYEFHPGVADLLLDAVRTSDALETAARVTEFLLHRQGSGPEFRARLSGGHGDSRVAEEARPFAAASPELLQRLGLLDEDRDEEPSPERAEPVPRPGEPAPAYPPRSYASERVQPEVMAVVRRIAADDGLPKSVRDYVEKMLTEADERDEETGWWAVRTLPDVAEQLVDAGWREHVDDLREVAREQIEGLRPADDLESRNLRGHLALTLNKLGEHEEAERELRAVVAISGRVHGTEHDYTLFARGYLVDLLSDAGRTEAAEEECRTLIEAWERREGDGARRAAQGKHQRRGRLLLDLDRVEEAEEEFRIAVSSARELYGPARYDTVNARAWLSTALRRLGRYDEAEADMRSAAEECEPAESEVDSALLTALFTLGDILNLRRRDEEAEALWHDMVDRTSAGLGPTHWRVRRARRNRVERLRGLRRYDEAEAEAEALVAESFAALGERHDESLTALRLRAMVLDDQRRYDEAQTAYRDLLERQTAVLGAEHHNTLTTRHHLASSTGMAGQQEEALEQFTQLLQDRVRISGPDAQSTLVTRYSRAGALARLGRVAEAEQEYRVTMEGEARVLDPDDPSALLTYVQLAALLRDQKRYEESEPLYRRVAEGRTRSLGAEAEATLAARHSLGNVLNKLGRFTDAETEIRETLSARQRVLGTEHVNTLWTRHNLGTTLKGLGRFDEAEAEWRAVLEISERVLGEEHNCTVRTREALAGLRGTGGGVRGTGGGPGGTEDQARGTGDGPRGTGDEPRGSGGGSRGTGDEVQGTGDGSRGTGDGSLGAGGGPGGTEDQARGSGGERRGTGGGMRGAGGGPGGAEDQERGSGDGSRGSGDGSRGTGDEPRGSGGGSRGTGDEAQGTGDGSQGTGDGSRGVGGDQGA
ncbi:SAV_2336 N-terminal domain-related protein [Streptomyces sp. S465]|uniref:SAV_2336 N-terminal domain-related protein n=1 Tax=Streptomyces sp. S465 TaxID=2979468 RepID=UPI0022A88119|nr:SAV_2336 N-terminal domain-related protein [Streptomyces sp. S465]WAP55902.1 SAV_2336 N-terminal domain-related protein [Streptomyces sp. S465]